MLLERAGHATDGLSRMLLNHIPQPVWICDRRAHTLLAVNEAAVAAYGYSREEFLAMTVQEICDREELLSSSDLMNDDYDVYRGQSRHQRKDGTVVDVELTAYPLNFEGRPARVVIASEQNEWTNVEESVSEGEERFRRYFELGLIGMAVASPTKGIVEVNNEICKILGYERSELLRMNWAELTHPDELAADAANYNRIIAGETDGYSTAKRFIRKDGEVVDAAISVKALRRADGSVECFLGLVQDITEHKKAAEKLEESEIRFRQLAENINEVFWLVDPSREEMLYVSSAYEEIWGRSCASLYERPNSFLEPAHPEDWQKVRESHQRQRRGQRSECEYRIMRPDGSIRWVQDRAYPIRDEEGKVCRIVGISEDITERKQVEERLRELAAPLENAVEGISRLDTEGRYVYVNQAYAGLVGYTPEEMVGLEWRRTVHPEDLEKMAAAYGLMLADGKVEAEARGVRQDGSVFHKQIVMVAAYDEQKRLTGHYCFMKDITERKRAEQERDAERDLLSTLIERLPVGVLMRDADGFYTRANCMVAQIFGIEQERLVGLRAEELNSLIQITESSGQSQPVMEMASSQAVLTQRPCGPQDIFITTPAGSKRRLMIYAAPVAVPGQAAVGSVVVVDDVTEQHAIQEQLRQAQKMEAIGKLAGGVAHDFNNLLTAINGYSDLSIRKLQAEDPLRRVFEEIKKAGERAAGLTQQLLAFSRKQVLQPKVLDLNVIVKDLSRMLQRLIGENIQLQAILNPVLDRVKADPGQIEQVIMNLVINACDAMPEGGVLVIETKNVYLDERDAALQVAVAPGHYVLLAVSDNGCGMDAETRRRIFEPFFTTKALGKGTGLGLSTAYGIIKQSGGSILVKSEKGFGSTFEIYLPSINEAPGEYAPSIQKHHLPLGTETILLAEDEEMVRKLARQILEMCGYRVLEAPHGGAALLLCERHDGPIHLMLTDVVMPEMSGRDLAKRLSPLHPEMKVLFMSGYTENEIVNHGVLEAETEFIQKPFSPDALASKVREVLEGSSL